MRLPPLQTFLLAVVAAAWLGAPAPARALLIEVDLDAAGDALVTRDIAAGLDWLDLTETTALSLDDVQGGAGGFLAAGWSVAGTSQVCGLFAAAGVVLACPGSRSPSTVDLAFLQGIQTLRDLLGVTNPLVIDGELRGLFHDGDAGAAGVAVANTIGFGTVEVTEDAAPSDEADPIRGVFLVRAVPEPAAGLLLLAALATAAVRRGPPRT